jgi:hypothetical protein
VSEYTNNRSTSVSGTVGFQGITPNVSATVSVTVGTSTTVTVPPVTIQNISNLESASTSWKFVPASPLTNVLYDTAESWTWTIDRDVYGATPNEIPEVHIYTDAGTNFAHTPGRCAFPPPFRTFDVTASMVTSVQPATVQRGGGTFLIRGARMYPGIVTNVLLGGDALPTSNFVPVSDTEIRVVVPSNQKTGKLATAKLAATGDPSDFLTGLASATHCSYKITNSYGAIEADPYIYTMRNCTDTGCSSCKNVGADYYLVQDNLSFEKYSSEVAGFNNIAGDLLDTTNNAALTTGSYNLQLADPATTTTYESSYTNSTSVTLSESVGFDSDGPNVSVGASVNTSQEMTYNVPPTQILNQSQLPSAIAEWEFLPQSLPVNTDFNANPTWTWFVPQDSYPSGGTGNGEIEFTQFVGLLQSPGVNIGGGGNIQYCSVPFPFSAWTVNPPELSSLASASTPRSGGAFTITGQYLYPGSVVALLIGGNAVPLSTNVDLIDANTIEVTVPGGYVPGTYPVQVNTQFNGENRFSNTLSVTLTN